ncbi:MAG: hypothetical protein V2J65_38035 [Desulfobacteraceae bacterium]|nr:hypothetical protein [Desulfobacteraceae bacterium]
MGRSRTVLTTPFMGKSKREKAYQGNSPGLQCPKANAAGRMLPQAPANAGI